MPVIFLGLSVASHEDLIFELWNTNDPEQLRRQIVIQSTPREATCAANFMKPSAPPS